jgi:hypothetical protein
LRRFLNVARRVESLAIHCRVTFFRAMVRRGRKLNTYRSID